MLMDVATDQATKQSFGQVFAAGDLSGGLVGLFSLLGVMLNGGLNRQADERRITAEKAAATSEARRTEQQAINSEGRAAIASLVGMTWEFLVLIAHRQKPEPDLLRRLSAAYGLVVIGVDRSVQRESAKVLGLANAIIADLAKTDNFEVVAEKYKELLNVNQDLTNAVREKMGVELIEFTREGSTDTKPSTP